MIGLLEELVQLLVGLIHLRLIAVDVLRNSLQHPILVGDLLVEVLRLQLRALHYPVDLIQLVILILEHLLLLL